MCVGGPETVWFPSATAAAVVLVIAVLVADVAGETITLVMLLWL